MIQTQHPTTQPLPVLVNERLCLDPGSCRCADSFHWCVCVCVAIPLHKRCLCFCVAYFFFFAPFFLAFCFKSNGTAEQIIRSSGCRDASPVHVEAAVTFIPLSSRQPVSRSIICRSVLQASGRFFSPLPQTAGEKLLPGTSPSAGRRRAFVLGCRAARSLKINCALIARPDERRGENVQVR